MSLYCSAIIPTSHSSLVLSTGDQFTMSKAHDDMFCAETRSTTRHSAERINLNHVF